MNENLEVTAPAVGADSHAQFKGGVRAWIARLQATWASASFSDRIQLTTLVLGSVGLTIAIVSIWVLTAQIGIANHTNRVAIRGQLYQTENTLIGAEGSGERETFATIWTVVSTEVQPDAYARSLLELVTSDSTALAAPTARDLYLALYSREALADERRRSATTEARRLFLQVQSSVYHVHNAHDYRREGVLGPQEWQTWKGLIGEMNAHPILVSVVWHGYQHRYFSRAFGRFLKDEICNTAPHGVEHGTRNCTFAREYYPEMFASDWLARLPHY